MDSLVKLHIMHCGEVKVDRALPYKELSSVPPTNKRGEKYQLWLPLSCYLIEHPMGLVVVDTGWHEDIRTQPKEHLGPDLYNSIDYKLPVGCSIKEQLSTKGLKPQDIDIVLISHLDIDHISGVPLLKGAKEFIVNEVEWRETNIHNKSWFEDINVNTFSLQPIPYGPYKLGKDLFGDGLIYLVYTPGHTVGQVSVLIRMNEGWVLLTSDAGYSEKSWRELIIPGYTVNEQQALHSLKWIQQFSQREDCLSVIANHDPTFKPQLI